MGSRTGIPVLLSRCYYPRLNYICDAGYSPPSMQVLVKSWRNFGSLSINRSGNNWTTTLGRHIDWHSADMLVGILTNTRLIIILGDMLTNMSLSIYQLSASRHIDRHITQVWVDMHKLHKIQFLNNYGHFFKPEILRTCILLAWSRMIVRKPLVKCCKSSVIDSVDQGCWKNIAVDSR